MAYNGSVELISGIKQKNGGDFPLVDASAVRVDDSTRLDAALAGKADKVNGKGLSTNDYTDADKAALDNIKTTDTDLETEGKAADAKATGDRITALKDEMTAYGYVKTDLNTIKDPVRDVDAATLENPKDGKRASKSGSNLLLAADTSCKSVFFSTTAETKVYAGSGDKVEYIAYGQKTDSGKWQDYNSNTGYKYACAAAPTVLQKTDSGFPASEETALTIPAGYMVIVTVKESGGASALTPYLYIYGTDGWRFADKAETEAALAEKLSAADIDDELETSGKAADAKATGDAIAAAEAAAAAAVDGLRDDVDDINEDVYEYGFVKTNVDAITGREYFEARSGVASELSSTHEPIIKLERSLDGTDPKYDSYSFIAAEEMKIGTDYISGYFAICVGGDPDGTWTPPQSTTGSYYQKCTNPVRYNTSSSNLPTRASPLTVAAGSLIVITLPHGSTPYLFIWGKRDTKLTAREGLFLENGRNSITISGERYTAVFSKVNPTTTEKGYNSSLENAFGWNITELRKGDGPNVIAASADIVGVLRISGHVNFIGGVHRNEKNLVMRILSDGEVLRDDAEQIAEDGYHDVLHVVMISEMYRPFDSQQPSIDLTSPVAARCVDFVFTKYGWTCRNTYKVYDACTIEAAYMSGLFSFWPADGGAAETEAAYTNLGEVDLLHDGQETDQTPYLSPNLREAVINTGGNLTVNVHSDTAKKWGKVVYRPVDLEDERPRGSFKVYFQDMNNEAVSAGTYITGLCEYRF